MTRASSRSTAARTCRRRSGAWLGDSRGRWDGNTLVVETTNFTDKTNVQGIGRRLRLVERFTRTDAKTLLYEFTVDDPARSSSRGPRCCR